MGSNSVESTNSQSHERMVTMSEDPRIMPRCTAPSSASDPVRNREYKWQIDRHLPYTRECSYAVDLDRRLIGPITSLPQPIPIHVKLQEHRVGRESSRNNPSPPWSHSVVRNVQTFQRAVDQQGGTKLLRGTMPELSCSKREKSTYTVSASVTMLRLPA